MIAKRFHNPGDFVEPTASDPVLRVIDPRRLEVVASVPLSESPRVVLGAHGWLKAAMTGVPDLALKVRLMNHIIKEELLASRLLARLLRKTPEPLRNVFRIDHHMTLLPFVE